MVRQQRREALPEVGRDRAQRGRENLSELTPGSDKRARVALTEHPARLTHHLCHSDLPCHDIVTRPVLAALTTP